MLDKLFKSVVVIFGIAILLFITPIFLYLFAFQPLQLRESVGNKYPKGAYVIINKLSTKFGSIKSGDIIAFKSLKNLDIDETGIIESIDQDSIIIRNYIAPISKKDIIDKVMFCSSGCK